MKETKVKSIRELKEGDIVRNLGSSKSYIIHNIIHGVNADYAICVRTIYISNPEEWIKINRHEKN